MGKVPVYIYFRIENGARDENGAPAPAYASLLLGHREGEAPPYEDLISKTTVHDVLEALPFLKDIYGEEQISFCSPEEYRKGTGDEG